MGAQPDLDTMLLEKKKADLKSARELTKLLAQLDKNHSGTISLTEFLGFMDDVAFRTHFEVRDVDIKDAELFFRMLATVAESDEVPFATFTEGCMRLKGMASSIDLHTVHFETKLMNRTQKFFHEYCTQQFGILDS